MEQQIINGYLKVIQNILNDKTLVIEKDRKLSKPQLYVEVLRREADAANQLRTSIGYMQPMMNMVLTLIDVNLSDENKAVIKTMFEILQTYLLGREELFEEMSKDMATLQTPTMQQFYNRLEALLLAPDNPEGANMMKSAQESFTQKSKRDDNESVELPNKRVRKNKN